MWRVIINAYLVFSVFLAEQFELLHPHLEILIPSTKRAFLQQFCSQVMLSVILSFVLFRLVD